MQTFFEWVEFAAAGVRLHLVEQRYARATSGEITLDLGGPFRLVPVSEPDRQRCLLIFGQLFDCMLDLGEVHIPMLPAGFPVPPSFGTRFRSRQPSGGLVMGGGRRGVGDGGTRLAFSFHSVRFSRPFWGLRYLFLGPGLGFLDLGPRLGDADAELRQVEIHFGGHFRLLTTIAAGDLSFDFRH